MEGWIKIVKAIVDNPMFWMGASPMQLWIYFLCTANYKTKRFGKRVINRGQLLTSYRSLVAISGWSHNTIKSYIDTLREEEMIEVESINSKQGGTLITIINYSKYQDNTIPYVSNIDTPVDTHSDTHSDTVTDTNIRKKEYKNNNTSSSNNTRGEILPTDVKLELLRKYYSDVDMISIISNLCMVEVDEVKKGIEDLANEIKSGDLDDSVSEARLLNHLKNYIRDQKRRKEAKDYGSNIRQKNDKRRGVGITATKPEDYEGAF